MLKTKQNKGITLIALVITTLILLILVGISIAMITSNNGIVKQAQKAKEEIEKGKVFQHFGNTERIKTYEIDNGNIVSENIMNTSASGHEKLVDFLKHNDINVLICVRYR